MKSAVDRYNTTEYIHGLFSLYFIRHSKTFLGIMWDGLKSEENCEMFVHPYAAFALCTMTVKYEELNSTKKLIARGSIVLCYYQTVSHPLTGA